MLLPVRSPLLTGSFLPVHFFDFWKHFSEGVTNNVCLGGSVWRRKKRDAGHHGKNTYGALPGPADRFFPCPASLLFLRHTLPPRHAFLVTPPENARGVQRVCVNHGMVVYTKHGIYDQDSNNISFTYHGLHMEIISWCSTVVP